MSALNVRFDILNQKGTPMFNSDLTANRPAAGIVGRIFIATDSPYGIFRDNGTSWDQIAISSGGGGGVTGSGTATQVAFWSSGTAISSDSALYWDNTNKRLGIGTASPGSPLDIHSTGTNAQFNGTGTNNAFLVFQNAGTGKWQIGNVYSAGSNYFRIYDTLNSTERLTIQNTGLFSFTGSSYLTDTRTYSTGSIQSATFDKQLTIPNAATISSLSTISSGVIGGTTTFQGSVTVPNSTTLNSNLVSSNINFTGLGTITMTQGASGIRAASAHQILTYFSGSASSTISHYAAQSIYGFFNNNTGTITPTITNAYMMLINDMSEYAHTFTFTNRWGIYQAGTSDKNYFAASVLVGTNVDAGFKLDISGTARISTSLRITTPDPATNFNFFNFSNTSGYGYYLRTNSVSSQGNSAEFICNNFSLGTIVGLSLQPNGNISFGTALGYAPTNYKTLEVVSSSNTAGGFLRMRTADSSQVLDFYVDSTDGLGIAGNNQITFKTGGSGIKQIITSGGNVLIGTTTDAGFKADINGSTRSQTYFTNFGTSSINLLVSGTTTQTADRGIFIGTGTFSNASVVSTGIGSNVTIGTGTGNVAIGFGANASSGGIAISGGASSATAVGGVAIGGGISSNGGISIGATSNNSSCISIGTQTQAGNSIAIGPSSTSNGIYSIVIGDRANVSHASSVILGLFARSTAANQLVIGSNDGLSNGLISDVYFGSGVQRNGSSNGAGSDYTINGSGALGTDQLGGNLTIAGGKGTGTGTPGSIIFSTATAGTTGTTLQTLTERVRINVNGLTFADGINIVTNATTGTKIATATTQKIGFWNAAPIVQPTTAVAAATFVAGTGTAVNNASTFDGYTIQQVVKALRNTGLLA